ncbi:MAG: Gfo/Idh/MocA family oxidoreductase [Gemmatimonadaceae bacterium]|nr:Gfo/Idh/MocA family oxidoreductase [Gemmatimonadaceae bacterium]
MRIGLVGAGKIGALRAQSIREEPSTSLAAVFDLNADLARQAAGTSGARLCGSLEELLDTPMDAVVVSTPVQAHVEACLGALGRGLHLLCEKPVANTVEDTRRIVQAAQTARRAFAVGFNLRYYPAITFMRETIGAGTIGTVDHFRVFGGHEGLSSFTHDWEYKTPLTGGGAMWDIGIHMTDLARHFLGEITDVYGVMSNNVWQVPGSEDNAMAVFRNPDGVAATYQATWDEWKGYGFFIEAYGDKGMVRGAYAPMENLLITHQNPRGPRTRVHHRYLGIAVREKLYSWKTTALLSFKDELRDFLALAEGKQDLPIADGFAGLRAVEVAAAVRESTATRQAVQLQPLGRMTL